MVFFEKRTDDGLFELRGEFTGSKTEIHDMCDNRCQDRGAVLK